MKYFTSLFFSICFCCQLAAQSRVTLSGYVKDAGNGEGLIGVSVFVRETGAGVATNPYGFYSITLPSGEYTLIYSYVGYNKLERIITLDSDQKLDVELGEATRQLEEVVISTGRDDENVKSIEMSVNKVEMKTIKKMPALLGEVDLIRSIQLLPGVSTVGEGSTGFNVRGGDISQNLVLLDEAPVYNSSHLFGFFSIFNPDAVKDVKLIKGGIGAQYGGRVSSILDVRMKEGNSKRREVSGGIGSIFSRLSYEQPFAKGKGSFIAAGRRSYIDVLAKPFLNRDLRSSKFYYYDLTTKVNYRLGEKDTFFASGYFGRDVFGGGGFGFEWGNATATARWNRVFSNKLFMNLTAYYSNYDYSLGIGEETDANAFNWSSRIISTSLKPDFTYYLSPNNQLTFGGQFIRYNARPANAVAISENERIDLSQEPKYADESALYIGNEQRIGERLSLQYGIRYSFFRSIGPGTYYDFVDIQPGFRKQPVFPGNTFGKGEVAKFYGNWEPRFSMNVGVTNTASVKASYNRTAQYLHLLSNTAAASPLDVWTMSSPNIKPQQADQVALGWFQNFANNAYDFSVELYYKKLTNQIDYVPNSDLLLNPFVEGDLLFGKGRAYGAEFYVKKNKGKFNGWLSYTLARTERLVESINNDTWFPTRFDKPHNLSVVAIYDWSDLLSLSANFVVNSGTPATYATNRFEFNDWALPDNYYNARNNSRIGTYHRLDLSATLKSRKKLFKVGEQEWVFSVYNAYNRRNPFSVFGRINEDNALKTEAIRYAVLGSIVPAITYNFKF